MGEWCGVYLLEGDGSDMAFLADECKSSRITFGCRSPSGDVLLDSTSTRVSGLSCDDGWFIRLSSGQSSIILSLHTSLCDSHGASTVSHQRQ